MYSQMAFCATAGRQNFANQLSRNGSSITGNRGVLCQYCRHSATCCYSTQLRDLQVTGTPTSTVQPQAGAKPCEADNCLASKEIQRILCIPKFTSLLMSLLLLPGAERPSWKFSPSQRPLSTSLDPGRRPSSFWSSFDRCPVWCYPPICTWVFLVIFWLEVSN
jgi:hypothetical protein